MNQENREVEGLRLGFGLQMRQTQRLILTPELRQAIAVLQLPVAELEEFIEEQLLENPCLEAEPSEEAQEQSLREAIPVRDLFDYLGGDAGGGGTAPGASGDEPGFEAFMTAVPTLQEHVTAQLRLTGLDALQRRIGEFLIDSLNDHGYLTISAEETAEWLGVTEAEILAVLRVIQGFDPAGVGARSLKECLRLQWETLDNENLLVPLLIEHHLEDLGEKRILRMAEALNVTPAEVQAAADLIRTLDPKPGRRFGRPGETCYVIPDVVVERVASDYVVVVNEGSLPRLMLNRHYRRILAGGAEPGVRRFIEGKMQDAVWLVRAIEQRRLTLYRVTRAIVDFQSAFFDQGIRHLCPLTLRDVADAVGVHESTVSRATAGKYLQTPRGTYEFKFFFSSGVEGAGGKGVAQESVKRMIADLIAAEEAVQPLSDQSLTTELNRQGVRISRRTVAKYREEMGIPSSGRRKRYR